MKIITLKFVILTAAVAEVGDYTSFEKAIQQSHIPCADTHLVYSSFDASLNEFNKATTDKSIHPLLRFMGACMASADQTLVDLAGFIKNSYTNDKSGSYKKRVGK